MELLAPAGNFENFRAALEAGADAVYVGAPGLNARNLARDISLDEIAAMVKSAHDGGRKLYVAINSLVREKDLPKLLETLGFLEVVAPDALIVQDLGVINLVTRYFPSLRLHASTLMTAHNLDSINLLGALGCARVVVARELTVKELDTLARAANVEIEVFIHGAMCFSYSGLCLFSSYLGGKSGLRGKCVQPCRRKFSVSAAGGKPAKARSGSGYLFSMNDLSGLELIPHFRDSGVASLKIEGRLRSAHYVRSIVAAYRQVMDADQAQVAAAIRAGSKIIEDAMGRRTSSGFFNSPQPKDAILQQHSGNIGNHLGRIETVESHNGAQIAYITLKQSCEIGERLRLHFEKSGERVAFTLAALIDRGQNIEKASAQQRVALQLPANLKGEMSAGLIEVYRVDVKREPSDQQADSWKIPARQKLSRKQADAVQAKISRVRKQIQVGGAAEPEGLPAPKRGKKGRGESGPELWVRLDSPQMVLGKLPFTADRYVLNVEKGMMGVVGQIKNYFGRNMRQIIWALPPIVHEQTVRQLEKNIKILIKSGFRTFQVAHVSQVDLFGGQRVQLYGDYSLNLCNSQAMRLVSALDFKGFQLAAEIDRDGLQQAIRGYRQRAEVRTKASAEGRFCQLGMMVYGAPALFTSRIAADHFSYGRTLISPKNEQFYIDRKEGFTQTRPRKPFSLLPYRQELAAFGLNYLVVDLCGMKLGRKELQDIYDRISGKDKLYKLPTFNYLGTLE